MHYDKQLNALVIPVSQIASVTRDGAAIDMKNAFLMNAGGQTITIKQEQNELDTRPGTLGKAKD